MKLLKFVNPLFCFAIAVIYLYACDNHKKNEQKIIVPAQPSATKDQKEAKALAIAYQNSLFEKTLSNSIKTFNTNNNVIALADYMSDAHTNVDMQMQALASNKGIVLPTDITAEQAKKIKQFSEEKGNDVNRDLTKALVDDHITTINMFEKAANDCTDSDIKNWITATLPELRNHLDIAMVLSKKLN